MKRISKREYFKKVPYGFDNDGDLVFGCYTKVACNKCPYQEKCDTTDGDKMELFLKKEKDKLEKLDDILRILK